MKNLKELFEKLEDNGFGFETYKDEELGEIEGILYGTDEMFDGDEFYQELVTPDGKVYRLLYDIEDENGETFEDFNDIVDYNNPYQIEEITESISYDNDIDEIIDYVIRAARIG